MNKLLENIVAVSGSNQEMLHKNLEKEQLARENQRIIETEFIFKGKGEECRFGKRSRNCRK